MFLCSGCPPPQYTPSFLFQGRPGAKKATRMKPESSKLLWFLDAHRLLVKAQSALTAPSLGALPLPTYSWPITESQIGSAVA